MAIRQSQETYPNLNSDLNDLDSPVNCQPYKNIYRSPQKEIQTTKAESIYKLISMADNAENAANWKEIEKELKKIRGSSIELSKIPSVIKGFLELLHPKGSFNKLELLESFLEEVKSDKKEAEFYQDQIFPMMANLILKTKYIFSGTKIPILTQGSDIRISLSEQQCACLIAHMVMCVAIDQGSDKLPCPYNFYEILSNTRKTEASKFKNFFANFKKSEAKIKLHGIFNYFKCLIQNQSNSSERYIVFEHLAYDKGQHGDDSFDAWKICKDNLTSIQIKSDGRIQDTQNATQVAFSDKKLGDQILKSMATQQSIMFFMSPELIIGCLFCEVLTDKDALAIKGAQKFNKYSDANGELKFEGDWPDKDLYIDVVLIDALNFRHNSGNPYQSNKENFQPEKSTTAFEDAVNKSQFSEKNLSRELNKAYVGFNDLHKQDIATGKWGCGTHGGNPHLKFIIQWIAASRAQRKILYYLYDNGKDLESYRRFKEYYEGKTVEQLMRDLMKVCEFLPKFDQASDSLWKTKKGTRVRQVLEDLIEELESPGLKFNFENDESARTFLRKLPLFDLMLLQNK